jgi:hypothetical protein
MIFIAFLCGGALGAAAVFRFFLWIIIDSPPKR